jgi:hypothetical protein
MNNRPPLIMLLPIAGFVAFIILYFVAASVYPGGSDVNKQSAGFSWQHNYWCELMAPDADNGATNTSRPIAITAMIILAASIGLCWYFTATLFTNKKKGRWLVTYPGILSMALLFFLFTGEHDKTINFSGGFGLLALIASLVIIFQHRQYLLFGLGIVCLILCAANNYIYYCNRFFDYLAIIQKITFAFFLWWFGWLTWYQYKYRGTSM